MRYRNFGKTGWNVSEISFGAWAIGNAWGKVDDSESIAALHTAVDLGANFIDTADVYGDGHSERLIAQLRRERPGETIHVATKAGRRLSPHSADGYNKINLTSFVEDSLRNLETDCLDLVQLHCPPTDVYYRPEVFAALDELVQEGKVHHYGVSVEKVEEGLKAIEYPHVRSVQIIFNCFRLRPAELFLQEAAKRNVAILARVPLASGLLTGKITKQTQFSPDDHRQFNRQGQAFDVGETFSGVPFEAGLDAVTELTRCCLEGRTLAQFALKWILMHSEVSCCIPGAKRPQQVEENAAASDQPPLSETHRNWVRSVYDRYVREHVHQRW